MKRIVAVAIGEPGRYVIQSKDDLKDTATRAVRRYLHGLVGRLNVRGYRFGTAQDNPRHFVINFHLTDATGLENIDTFRHAAGQNPDVIFCMSTQVARAAGAQALGVPIVGIVSQPEIEGFEDDPYCGVSAQRVQTADDCFRKFRLAVTELTKIFVLGNSSSDVSNRAMAQVTRAAAAASFQIQPIDNPSTANLNALRNALPERTGAACPNGLLVLPIDTFLSRANEVIRIAQTQKRVPAFFPVPDWVRPRANSALGAYGVPQRRCGVLMAEQVYSVFANPGQIPSGAARWKMADEVDFEFATSAAAADDLGITLGPDIPPPEE